MAVLGQQVLVRYRHFPEGPRHITQELAARGVGAGRVVAVDEGPPEKFMRLGERTLRSTHGCRDSYVSLGVVPLALPFTESSAVAMNQLVDVSELEQLLFFHIYARMQSIRHADRL